MCGDYALHTLLIFLRCVDGGSDFLYTLAAEDNAQQDKALGVTANMSVISLQPVITTASQRLKADKVGGMPSSS